MTGEIVNLRRARKARDRTQREATAAANRVTHGRTRAEREVTTHEQTRAGRLLDGHRLETRPGDGARLSQDDQGA